MHKKTDKIKNIKITFLLITLWLFKLKFLHSISYRFFFFIINKIITTQYKQNSPFSLEFNNYFVVVVV